MEEGGGSGVYLEGGERDRLASPTCCQAKRRVEAGRLPSKENEDWTKGQLAAQMPGLEDSQSRTTRGWR